MSESLLSWLTLPKPHNYTSNPKLPFLWQHLYATKMVNWRIKNDNIREFMAELLGTCTLVVSILHWILSSIQTEYFWKFEDKFEAQLKISKFVSSVTCVETRVVLLSLIHKLDASFISACPVMNCFKVLSLCHLHQIIIWFINQLTNGLDCSVSAALVMQ